MSGVNVPSHYYTDFSRNVDTLLQQKDSRLLGWVTQGNYSGEKACPVDQVGAIEMTDVITRFAPMPRTDAPAARRWVVPTSSDLNQLVDTFDKLKLLTDPQSTYVQSAGYAGNRRRDRHIISGFFADAQIGKDGTSTEVFGVGLTTAAGQNVSVGTGGAASGANVAKFKAAKRRLWEADVDEDEDLYSVMAPKQHDDLLNEIQVISLDFNEKPVLVDGKITRFLGINMKRSNLMQTGTDDAAGTSTMVPVWAKKGMHFGNWQTIVTDISRRNDLQGLPWQAYVMQTGGATRLQLGYVVRIWCR
jgi:hypothetical protein